jgi:FkbM family methyltransferase
LILDTRRLFCRLLPTFEIATVCDVGSMDGSDALRFRRCRPKAAILALEPNPRNYALMHAHDGLRRAGIRVLPVAASDRRADAPFFVVDADYTAGRDLARRGMSSLYERADWVALTTVVRVPTVRLDELLAAESLDAGPIALWIDSEGMAFEVIRGSSGVLHSTRMIHVEVETEPFIGASQKVFSDIERTLLDRGFELLATDQRTDVLQFNALFIRPDPSRAKTSEILRQAAYERLRSRVSRTMLRALPLRLRLAFGRGLCETRCH